MPRAFFRKAFRRWLGQNGHRFNRPPRITLQRRDYLELSFRGVSPQIKGFISRDSTSFHIWHAGQVIDMLNDFDIDIVERRRSDGRYYCALCLEPVDDYASRQALWEQHCFEPLLEWANACFQPGNSCTLRCAMAAPVGRKSSPTAAAAKMPSALRFQARGPCH